MKKKPKPAAKPVLFSGGAVRGLGPVPVSPRKPPPRVIPGGPVRGLGPKPAAKKKTKKTVRRKLALGEAVACCSAEALAASLRLAGWPVTDADVLSLYELTAAGPDEGATISETLEAARRYGLAGRRPAGIAEVGEPDAPRPRSRGEQEVELGAFQLGELDGPDAAAAALLDGDEVSLAAGLDGDDGDAGAVTGNVLAGLPVRGCPPCHGSSVILGLDLPEGPHAVYQQMIVSDDAPFDGRSCWWSWGEPYSPDDFPGAVAGEAWEVTWPR